VIAPGDSAPKRVAIDRSLGRFDNYHGTAGSPLLYKDKVILFQDHAGGGFVTALRSIATGISARAASCWR
jgi:hypothetical protein